ncbi:hypothetical protein GE09DRAFT_99077 [Coniochaeta sp. 2T2.1]|nr:hypothetical protein GE09DRAFT_99077 [Coniochaeta sp. 2T2.1]
MTISVIHISPTLYECLLFLSTTLLLLLPLLHCPLRRTSSTTSSTTIPILLSFLSLSLSLPLTTNAAPTFDVLGDVTYCIDSPADKSRCGTFVFWTNGCFNAFGRQAGVDYLGNTHYLAMGTTAECDVFSAVKCAGYLGNVGEGGAARFEPGVSSVHCVGHRA